MKKSQKKIFVCLILALMAIAIVGASYFYYRIQRYAKEEVPPAVEISEVKQDYDATKSPQETQTQQKPTIPASLNLKMDFYAQAPFGNWDMPWQEACEEASILLVANEYFHHHWTAAEFNQQILDLVEWEKQRFGDYVHTTMAQTEEILNDYLHLQTKIHENPSYEDIQQILAQGHLIIMPLAGKKLNNPFFTNGGPVYHVVPVKGYKEGKKLITHDVGTRRGEDYVYSWEIIDKAFHDYAEPIENGGRRVIEVLPPAV